LIEKNAPASIAEFGCEPGRTDDVGEEDGGEYVTVSSLTHLRSLCPSFGPHKSEVVSLRLCGVSFLVQLLGFAGLLDGSAVFTAGLGPWASGTAGTPPSHHRPTAFQLTAMLPISMELRCAIHHLPVCAAYFVAAWISTL
jgi:hypothetical protein